MICAIFILSAVLICAGLAPALAQDLFVRPDGVGTPEGETPTLFVKPKKSSLPEGTKQYAVKYGDKLKLQQQKNKTKIIISSFDEMQEIGFKPRDAEEIGYYARMHTAVAQNVMYKRREKLMAYLEKQEREAQEKIARQDKALKAKDPQPVEPEAPVSGVEPSDEEVSASESGGKAVKKTKLYVEPSPNEKAMPTKVFKNY